MDIQTSIAELTQAIQKFIGPKQVLFEVAAQTLDEYNTAIETPENNAHIASLEYQINALRLLINDPDGSALKIRQKIKHLPYNDQHEIMTRWAWMKFHYHNLTQKHKSKRPFQCHLGEFHHWITEDYEYYVLLHFLPHLAHDWNANLLFETKPMPFHFAPDFIVKHGKKDIGIEITIAPEDETYGRNLHYRSKFLDHLKKSYQSHPIEIVLLDINRWYATMLEEHNIAIGIDLILILEKCNKLEQQSLQIEDSIISIEPHKDNTILVIENRKKDTFITLSIHHNKTFNIVEGKNLKAKTSLDKQHQTNLCCQSILSRINAKNSSQFSENTILVIWPMNQFNAINYHQVAKKLNRMAITSKFKDIWIFTPNMSHKLKTTQGVNG
ncbi:MAG: hypothetical protein ACON35_08510 [Candidatus Marinamargulisbacteria bacterium]